VRAGGWEFAPRLVPTIAAAAFIGLTLWLGRWQAHRAEEKRERHALLEARERESPVTLTGGVRSADDVMYRRVRARGRYVAAGQIFVDNRIHAGQAGFHVITPLALATPGPVVLVNRGWVARTTAYPAPPEVPVPEGEVTVAGLASLPPARFLELSPQTVTGNVWQNLSLSRYAAGAGREVLPVVILATPPAPGLAAVEETPFLGVEKHEEYMLTWYSLAATAAALWVGLNLRRERR
jgi:surfeit locus 1 family protein